MGSRSSAIIDLDDDGDQDILTSEFNQPPLVLLSNLSEQKKLNFVKIKLVGTTSNRDGLGATVKVYAGDEVYTRVHDGKSGYLGQSVYPLYFGLGDNKKIKKVEVTWPSGITQVLKRKLKTGRLIEIVEKK